MGDSKQRIREPVQSGYPGPFERRFLLPQYWPIWLGVALLWCLSRLPQPFRHGLARMLAPLLYKRSAKRREIVHTNLWWALRERDEAERERLARAYFYHMAQAITDLGIFWWSSAGELHKRAYIEGREHLDKAMQSGQSIVLLTAHSIYLDFSGLVMTSLYPVVTYHNKARNPLVEWLMARARMRFGCLLYPRESGIRPAIKAVKKGYILYYVIDEDMGPEESVFAPFFGINKASLSAPARLTRMCKARALAVLPRYDPGSGRYVITISAPLEGFPGEDEQVNAAQVNKVLEGLIRKAPEQYMWSLRLFRTRPDGSPAPYRMEGKRNKGSGPRPPPPRID